MRTELPTSISATISGYTRITGVYLTKTPGMSADITGSSSINVFSSNIKGLGSVAINGSTHIEYWRYIY